LGTDRKNQTRKLKEKKNGGRITRSGGRGLHSSKTGNSGRKKNTINKNVFRKKRRSWRKDVVGADAWERKKNVRDSRITKVGGEKKNGVLDGGPGGEQSDLPVERSGLGKNRESN